MEMNDSTLGGSEGGVMSVGSGDTDIRELQNPLPKHPPRWPYKYCVP